MFGKRRMGHLGLASSADRNDATVQRCGFMTCAGWGAAQEWFIVKATGTYIVGIFAGRESTDQMSGLIGAAQMAGEMAKISFWELFSLAAWFSVSVGLMNLLAGAVARRRPPCVLRLRGPARASFKRAGAGDRAEDRNRPGRAPGGFYHFPRHLAPGHERQLTNNRPCCVSSAQRSREMVYASAINGLQARSKNCKTPLIVPTAARWRG